MSPAKKAIRAACQAFLDGTAGAAETCSALLKYATDQERWISSPSSNFIVGVASETDALPIGKFKDNWHPDFLPAKLMELHDYEKRISGELKLVCQQILEKT